MRYRELVENRETVDLTRFGNELYQATGISFKMRLRDDIIDIHNFSTYCREEINFKKDQLKLFNAFAALCRFADLHDFQIRVVVMGEEKYKNGEWRRIKGKVFQREILFLRSFNFIDENPTVQFDKYTTSTSAIRYPVRI